MEAQMLSHPDDPLIPELLDELMYNYVGNDLVTSAEIELRHGELQMARLFIDTAMNVIACRQQIWGRAYKVSGFVYYMQGEYEKGERHLEAAVSIFVEQEQNLEIEEVETFLLGFSDVSIR